MLGGGILFESSVGTGGLLLWSDKTAASLGSGEGTTRLKPGFGWE